MKDVIIASAVRTAVGKAPRGTLRTTRPDDLAAFAINGALDRVPQLDKSEIEDVILGCAMPEAEQGMNVARVASFRAGLPITTQRHDHQSLLCLRPAVDRASPQTASVAAVPRSSSPVAPRACPSSPSAATRSRSIRGSSTTTPALICRWG